MTVFVIAVELWRFMQWIIPSTPILSGLFVSDAIKSYMKVLSFFNNLTGYENNEKVFFISLSLIFIILVVSFQTFVLYLSSKFKYYNKVNKKFLIASFVILEGPLMILHPIVYGSIARNIGNEFISKRNFGSFIIWVFIGLDLIFGILSFYFQIYWFTQRIQFNYSPFASYINDLQPIMLFLASSLNFFSNLIPYVPTYLQYVLYVALIVGYFTLCVLITRFTMFISELKANVMITLSALGIILCLENMLFMIVNLPLPYMLLIANYLIFVILFLISRFMHQKLINKYITHLDEIFCNHELYDKYVTTLLKCTNYASIAFQNGHPVIQNWKFMRSSCERWQFASYIWVLWGRFLACYPEETKQLSWISDNLLRLNNKKLDVISACIQIHNIIKYREHSMSFVLKKRIHDCQKLINLCKTHYKKFWDCVLQGNIKDIEYANIAAFEIMRKTKHEIELLMDSYPNNHFVLRVYNIFLEITRADPNVIKEWTQKYHKLKSGTRINTDSIQKSATISFPKMLQTVYTKKRNNKLLFSSELSESTIESKNSSNYSNNFEESSDENQSNFVFSSFHSTLNGMKTPVISKGFIIFFITYVVLFFTLVPFMIVLCRILASKCFDYYSVSVWSSSMATSTTQLVSYTLNYLLTSYSVFSLNTSTLKSDILEQSNLIGELLNNIKSQKVLRSSEKYTIEAFRYFFEGIIQSPSLTGDVNNPTLNEEKVSIEKLLLSVKLPSLELISLSDRDSIFKYSNETLDVINMILSYEKLTDELFNICDLMRMQMKETYLGWFKYNYHSVIYILVFFNVIYLIYIGVFLYLLRKSFLNYDTCYLMLPKNVVARVSSSFLNKKNEEIGKLLSEEVTESLKKMQEESVIGTLSVSNTNSFSQFYGQILLTASVIFILIITDLLVIMFYYRSNILFNFLLNQASFSRVFYAPYSYFVSSLICLMRLLLIDIGYSLAVDESIVTKHNVYEYLNISRMYFKSLIFGNSTLDLPAIYDLHDQTNTYFYQSEFNDSFFTEPEQIFDMLAPVAQYFNVYNTLFEILIISSNQSLTNTLDLIETETKLTTVNIYENFIANESVEHVYQYYSDHFSDISKMNVLIMIVLCILSISFFLLGLYSFKILKSFSECLLIPLSMCPVEHIISNTYIMHVITGYSMKNRMKQVKYDPQFWEEFLENPYNNYSLIITDSNLVVTKFNDAAYREFGNIKNKKIYDVISYSSVDSFNTELESAILGRGAFNFTSTLETVVNDEKRYISITVSAHTKRGFVESTIDSSVSIEFFSFCISDITLDIKAQIDYDIEEMISNKILTSIIPHELVNMYKEGENQRIFFSVPSATVVFIKVSKIRKVFSSDSAYHLIGLLSELFSTLEKKLSSYKTLTRVSVDSQLLVVASGLFTNENSGPELYAKESVQYAIDCLLSIKKMNSMSNSDISVQIMINSGGPVIAGIYTIDRPYFDIFGNPVSTAYDLLKYVEPMTILITRYVYELIYGPSFTIKEAGIRTVDNNRIQTYNVLG